MAEEACAVLCADAEEVLGQLLGDGAGTAGAPLCHILGGSEETGKIPWDGIATMKRDCKNVQFRYSFTLYGRKMDLDAEKLDYRGIRTASVAIDMGNVPYSVAKGEIMMYKEQSGSECSYGLDGTSYNGRRARTRSLIGFADLLIPLLIAAITVVGTILLASFTAYAIAALQAAECVKVLLGRPGIIRNRLFIIDLLDGSADDVELR